MDRKSPLGMFVLVASLAIGISYMASWHLALPAAAISGLVLKAGITVVYLCICAEEIFKLTASILRFRSKKWINDVTREQIE